MTKIEAYDELYEIIKKFSPMCEDDIDDTLYNQMTFQDIRDAIIEINDTLALMKEIIGEVKEND